MLSFHFKARSLCFPDHGGVPAALGDAFGFAFGGVPGFWWMSGSFSTVSPFLPSRFHMIKEPNKA